MTITRASKIISLINNLNLDNYDRVFLSYNKDTQSIEIKHEPSNLLIKLLIDIRDDMSVLLSHDKNEQLNLKWVYNASLNHNNLLDDDLEVVKTSFSVNEISYIISVDDKTFILRKDIYKFLKTKGIQIFNGTYKNNTLEMVGMLNQPSAKDIVFNISIFTIEV